MMNSSLDNFETTSKLGLIQENQQPSLSSANSSNLKRNKILIRVFFSSIILVALITGAMIINLIQMHRKNQEKVKLDQQTESLRVFCYKTRFPDPCLNSTILLPNNDTPDDIFDASLQIAIKQVVNLTSLARALILRSTAASESRNESGLLKCSSLIDDSLNQLNLSWTASGELSLFGTRVDSGETEILVKHKIGVMSPWLNEAVNDLWRCFGILEKDNSTAVMELRSWVHESIMHVSNIYDFLASRDEILSEIGYQRAMNLLSRDDFDYLSAIIIFSPQYFVLIFLLCLLLGRYRRLN